MAAVASVERTSQDCVRLTLSSGSCFFIRLSYLRSLPADSVVCGRELSDSDLEDVAAAGFAYSAERTALAYLDRSEHCRLMLSAKLRRKGFSPDASAAALDFLEARGLLSDIRYAEAWLRNRSIHHAEGRQKLLCELVSRGVGRKTAEEAVRAYFSTVDEASVLARALEKCRRLGKTGAAAEAYLLRQGFALAGIREMTRGS